jgi:uracil-DNA glycosylase family 4
MIDETKITAELTKLNTEIVECLSCKRLVAYREQVAKAKIKRFKNWDYWGKPLPGFGDPKAEILILGLAPAAHGGNRTGRMFTGDSSGDFLMASLYRTGLSSSPASIRRDDGLTLTHTYITASLRCAPPDNRPTKQELDNCFRFLRREFQLLANVKVIVALGFIAFKQALKLTNMATAKFGHGNVVAGSKPILISSYHPSRRNTQTGLLTPKMLDEIFLEAKKRALLL